MNISEILRPRLEEAGKNAEKLVSHFKAIDIKWGEDDCNPMTDVAELLKELEVL